MTGRCPDMEHGSAAAQLPRSRRTLLVLVSLLCAVGLMSAAVSRAVDPAQHHRATPAVAAVAKIADGHGTSPRSVPHLLADTTTSALEPLSRGAASAAIATRAAGEPAATVRTRGPPGRA